MPVSLALAFAMLAGLGSVAEAHTRSTSYSRWVLDERGATVQLELSLLDSDALARGLAGELAGRQDVTQDVLARALTQGLRLSMTTTTTATATTGTTTTPCPVVPGSFTALAARPATTAYEWRVVCAATMPNVHELHIHDDLLFDQLPDHVHFAGVERAGQHMEFVLTYGARQAAVPTSGAASGPASAFRSVSRHLRLGVAHILGGWDHLLFVLTLLLAARGLRRLAVVVTGFTVGHSLTLALAATGHARVHMAGVEALIGLSIVLLAVDSAWLTCARHTRTLPVVTVLALGACAVIACFHGAVAPVALLGLAVFSACYFASLARVSQPIRVRGAVAALFGLLHGFGFAGALAPLRGSVSISALFGFNLGVELGQLAVIALAWPMLSLARRHLGHERVVVWGATVALALGVALFASRAY